MMGNSISLLVSSSWGDVVGTASPLPNPPQPTSAPHKRNPWIVAVAAAVVGAVAVAFISQRVSAAKHQIDAAREDMSKGGAAVARG